MGKTRAYTKGTASRGAASSAPTRNLLAGLFAEANKLGIDQETLRNEVAPAVIKKRLSMASGQEILRVIEHITGRRGGACSARLTGVQQATGARQAAPLQKYESSKSGLLQELEDVAKARWGDDFSKSLNAFVNANREIPTHYKMMGVAGLKALKERIKEMNRKDKE